eukprot:TRINITY_DN2688_c0_g2_i1.p1 TRINITY_DN2688_c0_g2~~TRINITY_DN2688_c0_g2_i1.p1  ORF type:complete len:224 (+),score=53.49 TRINITY_DN2688_c0_g2_i1:140-811(+)
MEELFEGFSQRVISPMDPYIQGANQTLQQQQTLLNTLKCSLFGHGKCTTVEAFGVSLLFDPENWGLNHIFSIVKVRQDGYRVLQGYVGEYDLKTWIVEGAFGRKNYSVASPYAGELNTVQMSEFLDEFGGLMSGSKPWGQLKYIFSRLFWISEAEASQKDGQSLYPDDSTPRGIFLITPWQDGDNGRNPPCEQNFDWLIENIWDNTTREQFQIACENCTHLDT